MAYALTWLALLANIVNDWVTQQWISPLSIIFLVLLGGGTIVQLARGKPIISTEGMANRFLITLVLILITLTFLLGRVVLSVLG